MDKIQVLKIIQLSKTLNLAKIIIYIKEFLTYKAIQHMNNIQPQKLFHIFEPKLLVIFFTAILLMEMFNFWVQKIGKNLFCHMKNNVHLYKTMYVLTKTRLWKKKELCTTLKQSLR